MIKKVVEYTDYDGNNRKEEFWFNLTQAELMEMQWAEEGGMAAYIKRIQQANNYPELMKLFKKLVLQAYGVKSPDGRRFIKSDTLREEFTQTEAFSKIFMELATDDVIGAEFVNGIMPNDIPKVTEADVKEFLNNG